MTQSCLAIKSNRYVPNASAVLCAYLWRGCQIIYIKIVVGGELQDPPHVSFLSPSFDLSLVSSWLENKVNYRTTKHCCPHRYHRLLLEGPVEYKLLWAPRSHLQRFLFQGDSGSGGRAGRLVTRRSLVRPPSPPS